MDIFRKIKQEKSNLIDPIDLFTELSKLINEPITIVATAFIRLNNEKASVNIYPYEYDPVNGIKKSPYNHENFIEAIVNGYERVIITDEIDDHWVGFWGLSKNGQLDYDINGINAFRPFYFIREEVNDFLNLHSIPLPPCITKKVINNTNNNDCINNDNKLQKRTSQLEQKLKIQNSSLHTSMLGIGRGRILSTWEVATIINTLINGCSEDTTLLFGYEALLLDAVANNRVEHNNDELSYDINGKLWQAHLSSRAARKWAKENNFPFAIFPEDYPLEVINQDNNELLQQIKQLDQVLTEQKNINHNITDELKSFKIENDLLKGRINELKKEIEKFKNNDSTISNNQPKKESQKTINAQSKLIKSLLYIHYGEDVANNPRPHIEKTSGEIRKDFESKGLSRELPSCLTVKRWVDNIELDIDS